MCIMYTKVSCTPDMFPKLTTSLVDEVGDQIISFLS
jgi:hypothetical protein